MSTLTPLVPVPRQCPKCQHVGSVGLEATVVADMAALHWRCRHCQGEWPVKPADSTERRRGLPDRRKKSRSERRSKRS
jgi:hypothetical protein